MKTRKKTLVVIFDCDGVLFDSRQANIHFYNHLLEHFGLPLMDEEEIAYVHMRTADESIRRIFRGSPLTDAALDYRWKVDFAPFIRDMVPEPGLREVLACLGTETGLGVATNRSHTIDTVLERHELTPYFDVVISSLDVKRPKPHPEGLFKILAHFDIEASQALYVGDSSVDAETALAAGVPFAAYKDDRLPGRYHVHDLWEVARIVLGGEGKGS